MALAAFNWGVLRYDWDAPEIADFAQGLDRVNAAAERFPGFLWRLSDVEMEAGQLDPNGPLGGNPRLASTLSLWRDAESLKAFVWRSIHKLYFARRTDWFAPDQGLRLVMWRVPATDRPNLVEAAARAQHLRDHGDSDHAFGWAYLGLPETHVPNPSRA